MNAKEAKYSLEMTLYYLKNISGHMEEMAARRSELDKELVDLDHELRLSPLNAVELTKLAIERRRVLRDVAKLKDEMQILWKLQSFAEDNYGLKQTIGSCVQSMNDVVRGHSIRVYKPRIRQGMKCSGKHCVVG